MSQFINFNTQGLFTYTNELTAGEGTLKVADNVVINQQGVVEMCRGFEKHKILNSKINKLIPYNGKLLTDVDLQLQTESGSLRMVHFNSNHYIATDRGLIKIEDSQPILAGMPPALDVTATLFEKRGYLQKEQQVAYRVVWGYIDSKKNLILGAPSQRVVITNATVDSRQVKLDFAIPNGITVKHFYQIYRSEPSLTASDELSLILQKIPTLEEIQFNRISIIDNLPRNLEGAGLYTNETQEGILQANDRPPTAQDIAVFKDCLFFGNTKSLYSLILKLETIGAPDGLSEGDVLSIGAYSFKASGGENLKNNEFQVSKDPSSRGISETISSLIRVINQSSSGFYAYSFETNEDPDDIGKILVESKSPFHVKISSHLDLFSPSLPQDALSDQKTNAIFFSKTQQPESVPRLNYISLGSSENEVLRLIPLRDSLFCLTSEGIFRIIGSTPESFSKELCDSSVRLIAPESAVILGNQIICLTNKGVSAIGDSGISILSNPIKDIIAEFTTSNLRDLTRRLAFAVPYESENSYLLFLPSTKDDQFCTQILIYNFNTNTWTRQIKSASDAIIPNFEDKLYLATGDAILVERKGTESDYLDENNEPIQAKLEFHAHAANNPFSLKQWQEVSLLFRRVGKISLEFTSNLSPEKESTSITPISNTVRTYIPPQKQLAQTITIGLATSEPFTLQGVSLTTLGQGSERISR